MLVFEWCAADECISRKFVTASVPANSYGRPDEYGLHIAMYSGERPTQSDDVKFIIE